MVEMAGTSGPPLIPTPVGAGLVQPTQFEVQFQTSLEDLSAGEYLIYETGEFGGPVGVYSLGYISLDGSSRGAVLRASSEDLLRIATNRGTELWIVYGSGGGDGVLNVDLASRAVTQFAAGCEDAWFSLSAIRHSVFDFGCRHLDIDREVHFLVSSEDWIARGYASPPAPAGDVNSLLWLTAEKVAVQPRVPFAGSGQLTPGPHCILTLADADVHCLEQAPTWWAPASEASPDGQWVVVQYSEEPTQARLAGLVTLACVENPTPECMPRVIPGAEGLGDRAGFAWAPEGHRLLIHAACGEGAQASPIWIYDVDLDQTSKLTHGMGCYELGPGPWTANGEDLVLVDASPSDNMTVWLLSLRTGAMRRLTAGIDGIFDVPGLFTVP